MSEPNPPTSDGAINDTSIKTRVAFDRTNVPKSPQFFETYTNDVYIQMTPWDARFMFSLITELGTNQNEAGIIRVADVRMSLQMMKRVAHILTDHVEKYEQAHGQLALP